MDLQITHVILSKEISWKSVSECPALYVEMMRNRVAIAAKASYEVVRVNSDSHVMWQTFLKDLRRYLDGNNVGLYAVKVEEVFFIDQTRLYFGSDARSANANRSEGNLTVFFEDSGDYARFVKERAVNFKLSVY